MYRDSGAKLCVCFYIFIVVVDVIEIDGFSTVNDFVASNNFVTSRFKRQNHDCRGFECTSSGECIEEDKRCDGFKDCKDGSDEFEDCKTAVKCPKFAFTCKYGACIDGFRKCDGRKDCHDNSDEAKCNATGNTADIVQTNCKSDQFECQSGRCISRDDKCNGVNDCQDMSDETKEACLNQYCPGFTFQCDYGACIDGFKRCDRAIDCFDGSDEENCGFPAPETTGTPEPTKEPTKAPDTTKPPDHVGLCLLPPHPANGKWEIAGGGNGDEKPGMSVAVNTILLFSCDERHRLSTESNVLACLKDGWKGDPQPTCSILCDPLYSSAVTRVHCYDANQAEIKCSEATDGTRATFECETYYEPSDRGTTTRFCWQGTWNLPPPRCIPVCGEKKVSAEPLIINATTVSKGDYPWVAAIFQKNGDTFTNVCGGSMLTQKVILTAAHCVSNQYGDALPPEVVKVAVGKYYNRYNDTRDSQAQYSDAGEVLVHYRYKGDFRRYRADIAFIITKETLLLSKVVQPVCYSGLSNIHLGNRVEGIITGWGYTLAGGGPSEELKEVAIPFKDDATCYQELPPDWADRYFEADKFCAGHYNKSIAVCKGDSGGGLVFKNPRDGRFYVHGIVSIGKKVGLNCDIQLSSLYTRVASYYDWLEQVTSRYSGFDNGVVREAKNLISDIAEVR